MPYNFNLQSNSYHAIGAYDLAIYADGGLKTSSIEFMRFLHVFVNNGYTLTGEPFLTSKTVQEMLTVQYPEVNDVSGLTWWIEDSNYLHGGSDPGAKALVVVSKHEKWGFIFFANGGGLRTEIGFEFKHYVHEYLNSYGPPSS